MRDFLAWIRTLKLYPIEHGWMVADRAGWIPGRSSSRLGAAVVAVRAYFDASSQAPDGGDARDASVQ